MYRLLIVDDENHAIETVKSDLNQIKLGEFELYTAINIRQAKEQFSQHRIDIMLCDIEMPQGSGLELLEWVKKHHEQTECIFLTSHAEFKYAKQAIQLGSLEYLLKPVPVNELEQAVKKAMDEINKTTEYKNSSRYQELWKKHQPIVSERFWLDLLNQSIPSNLKEIKEYAESRNLPFSEDMSFIPVLLSVQRWNKELSIRDEKIIEYALKNSAEEVIIGKESYGQIFELQSGLFLIILATENGDNKDLERLQQSCESYIASCNRYFYCDVSCYIGTLSYAHEVVTVVENLKALVKNNVAYDNKVFMLSGKWSTDAQIAMPDMNVWSAMLKTGTKERVIHEVTEFFESLVKMKGLDARLLEQFHQDFLQMIYFVLNLKGIQAHQLFCDHTSTELSVNATRSVTDMMDWVKHTIGRSMDQSNAVEETHTVIEKIKQYIVVHLDEDELSREDIANQVYLHPDYLSRLFKKETGQSLTDYLLQERIGLAKELLIKTSMPISEVASSVGYMNFSHFTKMFKKHTDLNPREYRQKMS